MKEWEDYEFQIFEKFKGIAKHSKIIKNQRIKGMFSKQNRQIDILIKGKIAGKEVFGIVDCKKYSKRVDVKVVESFIGLVEDVGANFGIVVTNVGYTKGANNRIKSYPRDIRLDIVGFKYIDRYHFIWETCDFCYTKEGVPRGEISWHGEEELTKDGKSIIVEKGDCPYCGESYIKCKECGIIIHLDDSLEDKDCYCGNVFSIDYEYIGSGMTEKRVDIKHIKKGK